MSGKPGLGRITALTVIALTGGVSQTMAQAPQPAMVGSISSRFLPIEVLTRMLERPQPADPVVVLAAGREEAWLALKEALAELAVPIAFEDQSAGEIGHQRARLFRRLGKQPLSSYLSCGSGSTGPNADSYAVHLTFVAFLRPAGEQAVAVMPLLTAYAVDVAGGRNDPVMCTSTGRLESRIGALLRRRFPG